jgi:mannose-6-phosphate isomerase-like protein (cupin superfamily)
MTIAPGADAGPEEEHAGDQIIYVVEGEALVRMADTIIAPVPAALSRFPRGRRTT